MEFVVYVVQDFTRFIIPFQTSDPIIHLLHVELLKLIEKLLTKFIHEKYYMNDNKTFHKLVSVKSLNGDL